MRRIVFANQKGGVGKTTTTVNLGACLARAGKKVVMVDLDPQANLSIHCGIDVERGGASAYTLLMGQSRLSEVIRPGPVKGLFVLPSNIDLAGLEVELGTAGQGRCHRLRDALGALLRGNVDYLIMDCPPSLGLLTLNGMCVANEVFIPLQPEFFALRGLGKLLQTCRHVRSSLNPGLAVTGIITCMFDARTSLATEVLQKVKAHFGSKVFETVVRKNVRLAEAPGFGKPIVLYDPECNGSRDYESLAREVLAMETAAGVPTPFWHRRPDVRQLDVSPPAEPFSRAG